MRPHWCHAISVWNEAHFLVTEYGSQLLIANCSIFRRTKWFIKIEMSTLRWFACSVHQAATACNFVVQLHISSWLVHTTLKLLTALSEVDKNSKPPFPFQVLIAGQANLSFYVFWVKWWRLCDIFSDTCCFVLSSTFWKQYILPWKCGISSALGQGTKRTAKERTAARLATVLMSFSILGVQNACPNDFLHIDKHKGTLWSKTHTCFLVCTPMCASASRNASRNVGENWEVAHKHRRSFVTFCKCNGDRDPELAIPDTHRINSREATPRNTCGADLVEEATALNSSVNKNATHIKRVVHKNVRTS